MTGRHRLHMPIGPRPSMPSNLFPPAPVWPEDEQLADVERAFEPTRVFGPVSLPEQERADCRADVDAERVAELEREIRRTPRWQLVRLVAVAGVFLAAIVLALVLTGCTTTTAGDPYPVSTSLMQPEPEEDEPGFDCSTMRNRQCGPTEVKA